MKEDLTKRPPLFVEFPKRTDPETEMIIQHIRWRREFESHLGYLAYLCDPEIINIVIVWTHSTEDLIVCRVSKDADFKAARKALIYRGVGDNSRSINIEGDSPASIVADVWRYIA